MVKIIQSLADVEALQIQEGRRFFSAEHDEIASAATTDIYFVKTQEMLKQMGLEDAVVVAEIFARRAGVFAGSPEVKSLLASANVEVECLLEGAEFAEKEVVMRIIGRYADFGVFETAILGMLASSSGWATAARKISDAAAGSPVTIFGARHVHPAIAPVMERAAVVGGVGGSSCILGAKLVGKAPSGTTPHAFFLLVGDTVEGAKAYNQLLPPESARIILVDTFKDEVEESLRVAAALGCDLEGIRLDTPSERGGVTPGLVQELRAKLDMAGYSNVKIFVSGGLTPERLQILKQAGADAFGVGSYISGASAIDMTMDLKEVNGKPVAKRGRIPGSWPNPRHIKLL